jgi:putative membrane protein
VPFLTRLLVNAAALWVATRLVPGVSYTGGWLPFLGVAVVFGVVNAFIRPVAKILTFPIILLTLGIFALVVNGFMLWLTSSLSSALGLGFHVRGFWAAFWGALVVSIVSTLLSLLVREPSDRNPIVKSRPIIDV